MAEKTALPVSSFGGINKLHTRELGQASEGKNFWTRNGALRTREGCAVLSGTPSFTEHIRSIHSLQIPQGVPNLLVEEGYRKLWAYNGLEWNLLFDEVAGNGFSSATYNGQLILVNGRQKFAYDIGATALEPLVNTEGNEVPDMEFLAVHKDILFGWAPHFYPTDTIRFNGYEKDVSGKILGRSKDSWPPDFAIKVPDPAGSPVLACIPAGTHLLILTEYSYWLLYGDDEDTFALVPGGAVGVYDSQCVAKVGNYAVWLAKDDMHAWRVYSYSGTQPVIISQPVEELLNDLPSKVFAKVRAYGFGTKFWLLLPDEDANLTRAFVYDIAEEQWYIHEYPVAFTCICAYDEYLHCGTNDARVVKLGDCDTDLGNPITTEFTIGPIHLEGANKFKVKRIWFNAEPRNDFSLSVYSSADARGESGPYIVTFEAGGTSTQQVKLQGGNKGRDIYLRVVTSDKVNELQSFSLTVTPKAVK